MKTFVLLVLAVSAFAQANVDPNATKSPKQVIQEFIKLDAEGGRLAPQGWNESQRFFMHPEPYSPKITVSVVSDEVDISEEPLAGREATCSVFVHDLYGRIDPDLRFTPITAEAANGAPLLKGGISTYHLTLVPANVGPSGEWKINDFQRIVVLSLPTAIRYVRGVRDQTTDGATRRNAEASLATLNKLSSGAVSR